MGVCDLLTAGIQLRCPSNQLSGASRFSGSSDDTLQYFKLCARLCVSRCYTAVLEAAACCPRAVPTRTKTYCSLSRLGAVGPERAAARDCYSARDTQCLSRLVILLPGSSEEREQASSQARMVQLHQNLQPPTSKPASYTLTSISRLRRRPRNLRKPIEKDSISSRRPRFHIQIDVHTVWPLSSDICEVPEGSFLPVVDLCLTCEHTLLDGPHSSSERHILTFARAKHRHCQQPLASRIT